MPTKSKTNPNADEITGMAKRGEDISQFSSNQFTVVRPVRRVNVDFADLNVSRQAVIKALLRQALDNSITKRKSS